MKTNIKHKNINIIYTDIKETNKQDLGIKEIFMDSIHKIINSV